MKRVNFDCLTGIIFTLALIVVIGIDCSGADDGGDSDDSGNSGSGQNCNSGQCENKWGDGTYVCCDESVKYGRKDSGNCYDNFTDAYTGFGPEGGGDLPQSRECC